MIAMTNEINKTNFGGRPQVTCNSCHRGSTRPAAIPAVLESDPPAKAAAEPPTSAGPAATPDQIIEKYVLALGGADAIRKISSRAMTGNILAVGSQNPIDVLTKAPNKRVSITHGGGGDSFTAFDGAALWIGNTGRPATQMSEAESKGSALDSEFYLALRLKELYPQLRRGRPETVAGVNCEVLSGTGAGYPAVRLYFDKTSGLLVRMVRYAETPLGRIPTQIDYADYRESDGVKTPFRWTLSRPSGRFTIQIATVNNNVTLDDSRFAKPAGDVK
jgi:outer membrane lipoprotein-sorting protein